MNQQELTELRERLMRLVDQKTMHMCERLMKESAGEILEARPNPASLLKEVILFLWPIVPDDMAIASLKSLAREICEFILDTWDAVKKREEES